MVRTSYIFIAILVIFGSCTTSRQHTSSRYTQKNCEDFPEEYIPRNLNEALIYLDCTWTEEEGRDEFKNMPEDEATAEWHMSAGQYIRNAWGLWAKKRNSLTKFFNSRGITHPDDISSIILTSFHRQLNGKEIDLEKQIQEYLK